MNASTAGRTAQRPGPSERAARLALWSGLALIAACMAFASFSRLSQLAAWERDAAQYVASGVPMMTTFDAYYALRLARRYADGTFVPHGPAPARHYARPELDDPSVLYDQREPQVLPLISRLLAAASALSGRSIDTIGLLMPPLLSSLFMVPLFLCCWRLGAPAAGLMGALVATFCIDYYQRTSVGWVDTDCLNLFFPWTASLIILSIRKEQSRETQLLLSVALGIVLYVYDLWYGKPALTVAYVCSLAGYLLLARVSWQRAVWCVLVAIVCADILQFRFALANIVDLAARYVWPSATHRDAAASVIQFPQVWSTIGEARAIPWTDVLQRTMGRADLAVIGLVGFVVLAARRWRQMAALAPVIALGMLPLLSSQRFVFYLAPLIGIGLGVVVTLAIAYAADALNRRRHSKSTTTPNGERVSAARRDISAAAQNGAQVPIAYGAVLLLFASVVWPLSASRTYVPQPAIPAPIFRDLQVLARQIPADARIWTWWDAGFAIVDATGRGVYHDGSAQYTPQTNLIATSFASADPRDLYDLIGFVDREGNRGIRRLEASTRTFDELVTLARTSGPAPGEAPVYVLFTLDMLAKFQAFRTLGLPGSAHGREAIGIQLLPCRQIIDDRIDCAGSVVDLSAGAITRKSPRGTMEPTPLRRAVIVEGGHVLREREYRREADLSIEIVMQGAAANSVYLLDELAFESNLNRMFVLGRFDQAMFEEVLNDFPYARAFRVRQKRK